MVTAASSGNRILWTCGALNELAFPENIRKTIINYLSIVSVEEAFEQLQVIADVITRTTTGETLETGRQWVSNLAQAKSMTAKITHLIAARSKFAALVQNHSFEASTILVSQHTDSKKNKNVTLVSNCAGDPRQPQPLSVRPDGANFYFLYNRTVHHLQIPPYGAEQNMRSLILKRPPSMSQMWIVSKRERVQKLLASAPDLSHYVLVALPKKHALAHSHGSNTLLLKIPTLEEATIND